MSQPKPLASLSSTLLARKGTAKPAMRPQGFGGFGSMPAAHDDLGWNDMGDEAPKPAGLQPAAPAPVPPVLVQREALQELTHPEPPHPEPVALAPPPMAEARPDTREAAVQPVAEAIPATGQPLEAGPAPAPGHKPMSLNTARRIGRETVAKNARAAFTLRLDHERHLRLRLASALQNMSAQHLVTEALDAFLQSLPDVEELARQLPHRTAR